MRLHVLDFGLLELVRDGERRGFPGYLIRTDAGENILVDTGWPERYGDDPARAIADDGLAALMRPVALSPANSVRGQLATLGLTPDDLDLLILTHSDPDHIGGIAMVPPDVPVVISRAERALAMPRYPQEPTTREWPERAYQQIEGDVELRAGLHLLATPGHTPGHMSLRLELERTGSVVLAIDAVRTRAELEQRTFNRAWDEAAWHAGAERIARLEHDLLIFGHDAEQWPRLRKAPEFYD